MTSARNKYRPATHSENLLSIRARMSEHLSPAEERELEEAAAALRECDALRRHTAILRALLEALECRDIDGMMRADPELVRAVGQEIAKAAKVGRPFSSAAEWTGRLVGDEP